MFGLDIQYHKNYELQATGTAAAQRCICMYMERCQYMFISSVHFNSDALPNYCQNSNIFSIKNSIDLVSKFYYRFAYVENGACSQ